MVSIAKPFLGKEEKAAVMEVLDSGMIASSAVVTAFEKEFSEYIGTKNGIACSSGTVALEVALRSLGIGKGDKVLTTAFSFIASANAIVYVGAVPVFTDISETTFNMTPEIIEEALDKHKDIKAVLVVHLFGQSCNMAAISEITRERGILLIEDCAQSHGAKWGGKLTGSFADASCFSFYPTKNMTTSEGGMVLTDREDVGEKARLLINHGMKVRYYHDFIGYNYRMTNIAAAIGRCQLAKLDGFNELRRKNAEYYDSRLNPDTVIVPYAEEQAYHVYHQYTVKVKNVKRDEMVKHLEKNGIGYGIFYPLSMPEQKCYAGFGFKTDYAITDRVKNMVISLPVHPQLTDADLEAVVSAVNRF